MQVYSEVELSIGDAIRMGNKILRVVDIEGDLVCFRVEADEPPPAEQYPTAAWSHGDDGLDRPSWPR